MDKRQRSDSAAKEKRANILLTLCIVLIGIMLFLMTDKGANMLVSLGLSKNSSDYGEYTVIGENDSDSMEAEIDFDPETVTEGILANWPNSKAQSVYADAGKQEYIITSDSLSIAIEFMSSGGVFNSITVQYAAQNEPVEPKGSLSPIEQYIFSKECEDYNAHCREVRIMLNALLGAINGGTNGIDTALNMLHSAAVTAEEGGKVNSFKEMDMNFRIYTSGPKAEKSVVINIERNGQAE